MSEPGKLVRLYLARWPDGTATIFSAESFEHAVDRIDEIGDPQECEVVPFDGDLWLTLKPSDDLASGLLALHRRPALEVDSQQEIVAVAFPVLSKVVEASSHDGDDERDIDPEQWREASQVEADRILAPSPRLREAIEDWWDGLVPRPAPESE